MNLLLFILFAIFPATETFAAPVMKSATELIVESRSLKELSAIARSSELKSRRERACEIQRRANIAPTYCYSETEKDRNTLDASCIALSAKAFRLPKIDELTSKTCRDAIENRKRDLAYVSGRDASR